MAKQGGAAAGLGRLEAGTAADLAWLGDDLRARATWIGGAQVFG